MRKVLYVLIVGLMLGCGSDNSNQELKLLKEQNELLKKQLAENGKGTEPIKMAERVKPDNSEQYKMEVAQTMNEILSSIQNGQYENLRQYCCYECETDQEVIALCNMADMRMGDKIALGQMYRKARYLSCKISGDEASVDVFFPKVGKTLDYSLKRYKGRWLLVSM